MTTDFANNNRRPKTIAIFHRGEATPKAQVSRSCGMPGYSSKQRSLPIVDELIAAGKKLLLKVPSLFPCISIGLGAQDLIEDTLLPANQSSMSTFLEPKGKSATAYTSISTSFPTFSAKSSNLFKKPRSTNDIRNFASNDKLPNTISNHRSSKEGNMVSTAADFDSYARGNLELRSCFLKSDDDGDDVRDDDGGDDGGGASKHDASSSSSCASSSSSCGSLGESNSNSGSIKIPINSSATTKIFNHVTKNDMKSRFEQNNIHNNNMNNNNNNNDNNNNSNYNSNNSSRSFFEVKALNSNKLDKDALLKCKECGKSLDDLTADQMQEHSDYHLALKIQTQWSQGYYRPQSTGSATSSSSFKSSHQDNNEKNNSSKKSTTSSISGDTNDGVDCIKEDGDFDSSHSICSFEASGKKRPQSFQTGYDKLKKTSSSKNKRISPLTLD